MTFFKTTIGLALPSIALYKVQHDTDVCLDTIGTCYYIEAKAVPELELSLVPCIDGWTI